MPFLAGRTGPPGLVGRGRAFVWSATEGAAKQVLSLVLSLTILGFVKPHDLGVFSVAFALVLIFALITDDPIGDALIQRPHATETDWNTGFTINLALACGAFLILLAASAVMAKLMGDRDIGAALPALSTALIIGALGNVQKSYLARELRFRLIAQVNSCRQYRRWDSCARPGRRRLRLLGVGRKCCCDSFGNDRALPARIARGSRDFRIYRGSLESLGHFARRSFADTMRAAAA